MKIIYAINNIFNNVIANDNAMYNIKIVIFK